LIANDDFETFIEAHGGRKGRKNQSGDAKESIKSRK